MNRKQKLLFVCTGNINRSAAAHIILQFHGSLKYEVRSCGTGKGAPLNKLIAKRMRMVLTDMGYDPNGFRSRGVNAEDVTWADKIIVMAPVHLKYFSQHYPEVSDKVTVWSIADPHFATGMETHIACGKEIESRILTEFC